MSDALITLRRAQSRRGRQPDGKPPLAAEERGALRALQREATARGAKLRNGGRGGLPPSLVLHVMRRDGYRCKVCGDPGAQPVEVHHKGGVVESRWLSRMGHRSIPENLVTVCGPCHDRVHGRAREEGVDSSQVTPEADE